MTSRFDVIVVGLGAMGSATTYHLARRGVRVLGVDRFAPPHAMGSSHGKSRIIREAYFEHPLYVPLVQRAYELWAELERESGRRLFVRTGGLMLGSPDGSVAGGALRSARAHGLPHEVLQAEEVRRRFPALRPAAGTIGVWEPRAGFLVPEAAIDAHLTLARRHGAELRADEPLVRWRATGGGVEVTTPRGTYAADHLVLSAGAWLLELVPELALPLVVERNVLHWLTPAGAPELFAPERFPVFLCEHAPGRAWYGFPDTGDGVKVAVHHDPENAPTTPDTLRREVSADDVERVRTLVRSFLPAADGARRESVVCMYTNTPDGHFLVDVHPEHPQVLLCSPCSGHGFKFAAAIGELQAELLTTGRSGFDLSPFRLGRFG